MTNYERGTYGGLTGAALAESAPDATETVAGLFVYPPPFGDVEAPESMLLVIDPGEANEEVVLLTSHKDGTRDAVIQRGQAGTEAHAHEAARPLIGATLALRALTAATDALAAAKADPEPEKPAAETAAPAPANDPPAASTVGSPPASGEDGASK